MNRETAFIDALQNTTQLEQSSERLMLLGDGGMLLAELVASGNP